MRCERPQAAKRAVERALTGDAATGIVTEDDSERKSHPKGGCILRYMAGPTRLELATSGVTGLRSNQLNYDPAFFGQSWWEVGDSNPRPPACKAGALTS